jgi:hypothetical protein
MKLRKTIENLDFKMKCAIKCALTKSHFLLKLLGLKNFRLTFALNFPCRTSAKLGISMLMLCGFLSEHYKSLKYLGAKPLPTPMYFVKTSSFGETNSVRE